MEEKYKPSAWNFGNGDSNLISPNGSYKIEYEHIGEIAMGAPLGGACYLTGDNIERIEVSYHAGGPVIWDKHKIRVAFPSWTKERKQKLTLVDIDQKKIITYAKQFRVLELEAFEGDIIKGIDSPIYKSEVVHFDIFYEPIEVEKELTI